MKLRAPKDLELPAHLREALEKAKNGECWLSPQMSEEIARIKELDCLDEEGHWHIMCACGHRVSGSVQPGDKFALCPNCSLLYTFVADIPIPYPDRIP